MKKLVYFLSLTVIFISCSKSDDEDPNKTPALGTPALEHHTNDKVDENTDGTTNVVLGNLSFTTSQRDFSSEPKVVESKTVDAKIVDQYILGGNIKRFRISENNLVGWESVSAFESKIFLYDIANKAKLDEHTPDDNYLSGIDCNGAIVTVEGSEDLNFYNIENGKVAKHFFQIPSFLGSKFLSEIYMDHNKVYVFNSDEIVYFPLSDTKNVTKLIDVESFSQIRFTSDNDYMYILESSFSSSKLKFYSRSSETVDKVLDLSYTGSSVVVDANYLYVSCQDNSAIEVYNKHTYEYSGMIDLKDVSGLDKIGDYLYAFSMSDETLFKYEIRFK